MLSVFSLSLVCFATVSASALSDRDCQTFTRTGAETTALVGILTINQSCPEGLSVNGICLVNVGERFAESQINARVHLCINYTAIHGRIVGARVIGP